MYEGNWKKGGGMVAIKETQTNDSAVIPQEIKIWDSLQNITLVGVASDTLHIYTVTERAVKWSLM